MKRIALAAVSLVLGLGLTSCAPGEKMGMRRPAPGSPEAEYAELLDGLMPGIGAESLADREKPQQALEELCFRVARPGNEERRAALCRAMCGRVGVGEVLAARVWLLRQLERISGAESVPALGRVLQEEEPQVRDVARRALQNNPSEDAARALRRALDAARDSGWRVALINALGARRDGASTGRFVRLAKDRSVEVAAAALAALGEVGDGRATGALRTEFRGSDPARRELAAAALLRCADRALAAREAARAGAVYEELYESQAARAVRLAALRGLTEAQGERAVPRLVAVLRGKRDAELSLDAARLLGAISGGEVTQVLVGELGCASVEVRVVLLDVLADRGDASARPAVVAATRDGEEAVRMGALRALWRLGRGEDVIWLATIAAKATGAEHDAARQALARMSGADVDAAILSAVGGGAGAGGEVAGEDARTRAELIRSLADRYCEGALAHLFEVVKDRHPLVRQAAFESLGRLGGPGEIPKLIGLEVSEKNDEVREAAEDAVVGLALKLEDRDQRAAPVLAALPQARGTGKASLVRVLGRLQGNAALAAIRPLARDADGAVADAAIRALAQWEDIGALDDLLPLAREAEKEAQRALALRGYVRLLRLPSDRPAARTVELLEQALSLAGQDEDRKLVLGAVGGVADVSALLLAKSYLGQEGLRDEAATATAAIAVSLAGEQRDLAKATVDELLTISLSDAARQRVGEAREAIKRLAGFVTVWQYAGPFALEGKSYEAVFAEAFAPERPDAGCVTWRRLVPTNMEKPYLFDLTKLGKGTNCCVYVRATVVSPGERAARLDLGSDDGVKVWLNGDLIHSAPGVRSLSVGQDRVDIALQEGRNVLLLKVVQASGGWGFCCEVKGRDGDLIEGLEFKAD